MLQRKLLDRCCACWTSSSTCNLLVLVPSLYFDPPPRPLVLVFCSPWVHFNGPVLCGCLAMDPRPNDAMESCWNPSNRTCYLSSPQGCQSPLLHFCAHRLLCPLPPRSISVACSLWTPCGGPYVPTLQRKLLDRCCVLTSSWRWRTPACGEGWKKRVPGCALPA